jgi:hypothetical protein|tara:strand:- start:2015 stop:2509 length:495 start_codon:yes stop_codon:yes gene_type:complete
MRNIMNEEQLKASLWINVTEEMGVTAEGIALAIHLKGNFPHHLVDTFTPSDFEEAQHEVDMENYLVLTDKQADEWCKEEIEEMVWAFTPSFLQAHTGVAADAIKKIQEMCEGANEPLMAMIKDFDYFVEDAINCDGRGHFLAGYDHEEYEVTYNGTTYYIYRRN